MLYSNRVKLSILPPENAEFGLDQGDGTYSGLVGALQSLVRMTLFKFGRHG